MTFFPRDWTPAETGSAIEWEEPNCPLCASRHWRQVIEAPDLTKGGTGLWFAVVQCQDCDLCYTNPRPNRESIGHFYPSVYAPHRRKRPRRISTVNTSWERPRKERHTLPWHGQGRLLDFGCGGGSFLQRMHMQGWEVTGLDVSPFAVETIRKDLGLRAHLGTLPHAELQPESFDVVTMWHSLEHVHDPMEILRQAHRILTPGGKLLVAVPNIDSLPFRWFKHCWYGLDLPRHLTHFAPKTLKAMLVRASFSVGPIRMIRHSDWLRSSARLARQMRRGPYWQRLLLTKPTSRLATWYSYVTRQTDCILVIAERNR